MRRDRGQRQADVEQGAKLAKGLLSKYEHGGQRPNADTVERLAKHFGVKTTEIDPSVGFDAPARTIELEVEHYPSLAEALPIIRAAGYPDEVVEAVRGHRRKGIEDPGARYFVKYARELYDLAREARQDREAVDELSVAPDVSDEALDAAAKRKKRSTTTQPEGEK